MMRMGIYRKSLINSFYFPLFIFLIVMMLHHSLFYTCFHSKQHKKRRMCDLDLSQWHKVKTNPLLFVQCFAE